MSARASRDRTVRGHWQGGFTLLEAVVVIVITGIVSAMVAVFIRAPVEGYIDSVARAELTDAADTALRRLTREVRTALPNSLREGPPGAACIEFLPTLGGGRYRVAPRDAGTGDILGFSLADQTFDVLAQSNLPPPAGFAGTSAVVYNLGITDADAYNPVLRAGSGLNGVNRVAINAGASGVGLITLAAANQFPFRSPGNRFQVIANNSVVYYCANNAVWRATRALPAGAALAGPAACPQNDFAGPTLLVGNVDCATSSFTYAPAAAQRNGILAVTLVLTQPGARAAETISLYQEVQVDNTP